MTRTQTRVKGLGAAGAGNWSMLQLAHFPSTVEDLSAVDEVVDVVGVDGSS